MLATTEQIKYELLGDSPHRMNLQRFLPFLKAKDKRHLFEESDDDDDNGDD